MSLFHTNTLLGASGSGGDPIYSDDVFQTHLYTGTGSARTITNNIDLSGEGGLVWIKERTSTNYHVLTDTERGAQKSLYTNVDNAEDSATQALKSFTSSGFTLGTGADVNGSNEDFCSWTFRKCPGFFDIVTWTGNGSNRTISHSIGSTPGFIIVKRTSNTEDWTCWHRSLGATKYVQLNGSNLSSAATLSTIWNDTEPTSTVFSVGTHDRVNTNGETYVAYIFAHDDQSFGTDSDEAIIKCGTFAGASSPNNFVNIGFEPQWVMTWQYDDSGQNWEMADIMRGAGNTSGQYKGKRLFANITDAEANYNRFSPKPTGFDHHVSGSTSDNFVYIAIRRPHKPPTAGTDVFKAVTYAGSGSAQNITGAGFAPDWMWSKDYGASNNGWYHDRLRVQYSIDSSTTGAEQDRKSYVETLGQDGINFVTGGFDLNRSGNNHVAQFMKRAPGFFDIVTYLGNGSGPRNITHNLGVIPEFIISKNLSESRDWRVWHKDLNGGGSNAAPYNLILNSEDAQDSNNDIFGGSSNVLPTSSVYTVGQNAGINESGSEQVAWLFASLSGISKVGSYSGSSSAVTVDCGFAAAPRYILIKAINRSEPWYVFDHARGIVAGNDPHLQLDKTNAQNSGDDVIDPTSSGFTVNTGYGSGFNESGNTYIFFAIA